MNGRVKVSFIVPCYNLAHLLSECLTSILGQTYKNFEVLVMDDCSPDHVEEVVKSIGDNRIRYIRNAENLGHLRNYNKGIELAQGEYLWLISADDCLRRSYVLEQYVDLMERNRRIGYVFCSGVGVRDGKELGLLKYSSYSDYDQIVSGHVLLKRLLRSNIVLAASGLVRRECYERLGGFPLDMPWAGDWYLWCLFALYYDVGYFSEPMVCYREHELSMTQKLWSESGIACCEQDVGVIGEIKRRADESGFSNIARECLSSLAEVYARNISSKRYGMEEVSMKLDEFEESLCRWTNSDDERNWVRSRMYEFAGDRFFHEREFEKSMGYYRMALKGSWYNAKIWTKLLLQVFGGPGEYLRRILGQGGEVCNSNAHLKE